MRLKGKVAVVTGGGRGIGLGIARRLAAEGAAVAIAEVDPDRAACAADILRAEGATVLGSQMDVADEGSIEEFFRAISEQLGPASILVHAAAIWANNPVSQMSAEQWQRIHDVNSRGTFLVCKRAMQDMVPQGDGRIVNIASTIVLSGGAGFSHYAASKGAVIAFSRALAGEAGPHGITVNCIAPGLITTEAAVETHGQQGIDSVIGSQIVKRAGQPEDIAEAVAFFTSPGASFTTGQTLYVNGGTHFG